MPSAVPSHASKCVRPGARPRRSDAVGSNLSLKSCTSGSKRFCWDILVYMHRLGVLAKVIEP